MTLTFRRVCLLYFLQEIGGIVNGYGKRYTSRNFHGVDADSLPIQVHEWTAGISKLMEEIWVGKKK